MNILFRKPTVVILFLFFSVLISAAAQENEKIPRQLFIPLPESIGGEGIDIEEGQQERREQALRRYVLVTLAEQTDVVVAESEEDADCRLNVTIGYGEDELILRFRLYDIYFDKELAEWESRSVQFSLKSLSEKLDTELMPSIRELLPPRDPEVVEVVTEKVIEEVEVQKVYIEAEGVEVTLVGEPGIRLVSGTGEEFQIGEEGFIKLDLPVDSFFIFTAYLDGYYPHKQEVVIGTEPVTADIKMVKASRWGFDINFLLYDVALCPAVQFFYKPNYGYINFRITQNFLSLVTMFTALEQEYYEQPSLFFIQPAVGTGWYFFSPSSIVRLGVSGELSTRIVFPESGSPYISRIMPLALALGATGELSPFKRLRFYVGWHPTLYYRFSDLPLYDSYAWIDGVEGLKLFAGLFINLISFNMGVRILL